MLTEYIKNLNPQKRIAELYFSIMEKIFGTKAIDRIEELCRNNKEFAIIIGIKEVDRLLEFSQKIKKTFNGINILLVAKFEPFQVTLPQNLFKDIVFRDQGDGRIFWKIKRNFELIKKFKKNSFDIVFIFYENTIKDINIPGELCGFLSNSKIVAGIDGNGKLYLLKNKFFIYKFLYSIVYKVYKFLPFLIKLIILAALLVVLSLFISLFWIILLFSMFTSDKILNYDRIN